MGAVSCKMCSFSYTYPRFFSRSTMFTAQFVTEICLNIFDLLLLCLVFWVCHLYDDGSFPGWGGGMLESYWLMDGDQVCIPILGRQEKLLGWLRAVTEKSPRKKEALKPTKVLSTAGFEPTPVARESPWSLKSYLATFISHMTTKESLVYK